MKNILYLSAKWCGPCKQFSPVVAQICAELEIELQKVDITENPDIAVEYGAKQIPFLVYKKADEIKTHTGTMSIRELREFLQ